jgi:aminoglycoside/choline kinase family phosphotransferase
MGHYVNSESKAAIGWKGFRTSKIAVSNFIKTPMLPINRLEQFLIERKQITEVTELTPDASTREYFRVKWNGETAIACVYPEPFKAAEQNYLDVTRLFLAADLPVAEIYDFDEKLGVIVQEDFGETILRDRLLESDPATRENYLNQTISLIAKIQAATDLAFQQNSIASRLAFDFEKLSWELDFFTTHYFETLKKSPLHETDSKALKTELDEVAEELAGMAKVLTHRDFHAANLMIDKANRLRIIDHQDARIGSVAYDLVSLLLDRVTTPPSPDWLASKRRYFLSERQNHGLPPIDENDFAYEFRLQTIQRCLKAIGTFSFQSVNRGKTYFIPFIKPMFEIVLRAAENLDKFPKLREIINQQIKP